MDQKVKLLKEKMDSQKKERRHEDAEWDPEQREAEEDEANKASDDISKNFNEAIGKKDNENDQTDKQNDDK